MSDQQFSKIANRKKRYYKRKGKGLTPKQKQEITKMMEQPKELKFYDTTYSSNAVGITPAWTDLTAPAQGTEKDQLIGTELTLQSLQYHFTFKIGDSTNYIRYLILQWMPDSETDGPSWAQVFQYNTFGVPTSLAQIMSPYILDAGGTRNFKVLVDEQFYLDSDNPIQIVKGFINKGFRKNIECNGDVQDGTGHLFLMYVSDSAVSLPDPSISGYTRARYYDS